MKQHQDNHRAAVIFDLDGTLADTLEDITRSMNALFKLFEVPAVTSSKVRTFIGAGLRNLMQQVSGVEDPDRLTALVAGYRDIYRRRMLDHTRLFPGIPEMLDRLVESGIPLAVLSNKPHEFTGPICEALLVRWPFVSCLGAREEGIRKPDPTVALELATEMNRPHDSFYFVGDSSTDVLTARNAGMTAVAVTWGYRDRDHLEAAAPDHIVEQPMALVELLTARRGK